VAPKLLITPVTCFAALSTGDKAHAKTAIPIPNMRMSGSVPANCSNASRKERATKENPLYGAVLRVCTRNITSTPSVVFALAEKLTSCAVTTDPLFTNIWLLRAAGLFCTRFTDEARGW